MDTDQQHEAHDGLTCAEAEALLDLRTRQWQHRERQATHRLTPEEWRATVLDMFAAVAALNDGRVDDLEALAPTTIAEYQAQLAAAIEALALLTVDDPDALALARTRVVAGSYTREANR